MAAIIKGATSDKLNWLGGILIGQVTLSIIGMVTSILSAINSGEAASIAGQQADDLEKVEAEFIGAISLSCPEGREDPNVLECYCFYEDGSRRTDRNEAEGCQNLYSELDEKYEIESQDLILGQSTAQLSCVTIDGNPDPECNCKKFTDAKSGRNACYQVPLATGELGNIMSGTSADQITDSANAILGSSSSGNISNPGSILNTARKLNNVGKQLLEQTNKKLIKRRKENDIHSEESSSGNWKQYFYTKIISGRFKTKV